MVAPSLCMAERNQAYWSCAVPAAASRCAREYLDRSAIVQPEVVAQELQGERFSYRERRRSRFVLHRVLRVGPEVARSHARPPRACPGQRLPALCAAQELNGMANDRAKIVVLIGSFARG